MNAAVLFVAQASVFGFCLLFAQGFRLHPAAHGDVRRTVPWLFLGLFAAAFAGAIVGVGTISWVCFFLALTTAVALDVQAIRARLKHRANRRKLEAEYGPDAERIIREYGAS